MEGIILFIPLLTELNGGVLATHKIDMEEEEKRDYGS